MKCGTTRTAATKPTKMVPPIQVIFFIPPSLPRVLREEWPSSALTGHQQKGSTFRLHCGSGQEEDLLAYQLLRGPDEFGTRARYSTTSIRGRHRIGFHVRSDRPRLHHGLRGLGVY